MSRKQADTIDTIEIVTNPEFARGLAEVRAGLPFNPDEDFVGLRARQVLRVHRPARHAVVHRRPAEPASTQARRRGVLAKAVDMKKRQAWSH